jgi:hypothetical protein
MTLKKEGRQKVDPIKGLNPDQDKPLEDIQNGDPKAGANRDQRSGAAEAGGPNPSLDKAEMGGNEGEVPPHESPEGVSGEPMKTGAFDQAGTSPLWKGKPLKDQLEGEGATARAQNRDQTNHDEQTLAQKGGSADPEPTAKKASTTNK